MYFIYIIIVTGTILEIKNHIWTDFLGGGGVHHNILTPPPKKKKSYLHTYPTPKKLNAHSDDSSVIELRLKTNLNPPPKAKSENPSMFTSNLN